MIDIKCSCGFTADLSDFCKSPIFGELPAGYFQCPSCNVAWRRRESEHRILRAGNEATIIPGKVDVVRVDAFL